MRDFRFAGESLELDRSRLFPVDLSRGVRASDEIPLSTSTQIYRQGGQFILERLRIDRYDLASNSSIEIDD
jgi:hypothetical protein